MTMSPLHVRSKVCIALFRVPSEVCIAPVHVRRIFAPGGGFKRLFELFQVIKATTQRVRSWANPFMQNLLNISFKKKKTNPTNSSTYCLCH